jgi:deferrochelatase/peroxidase EfeB
MKSGKPRLDAIAIKPSGVEEERWTENGTYLAFLRLAVDLGIWRKIPRIRQEIIVGREKLTGCPIIDMDSNGNPIVTAGCPVPGTKAVTQPGNEIFHDIAIGDMRNDELKRSHVIRSNLKRGEPALRDSLRIFRQGYEFLEPIEKEPGFRVGLNFISFQDTPERLYRILTNPNWLGNTNFGGNSDTSLPGMDKLLSVMAGGIYLVPPISRSEEYPGSSIFI